MLAGCDRGCLSRVCISFVGGWVVLVGVHTCARDNAGSAGGQITGGYPAPSHGGARSCEAKPRNGDVSYGRVI